MGAHHPRHVATSDRGPLRRVAVLLIAPVAVLTLVAMVWLWPDRDVSQPVPADAPTELDGEVVALEREPCPEELDDEVNGCGTTRVRIAEGADQGEDVTAPLPNGPGAPLIAEGDAVQVVRSTGPDGPVYAVVDHQRSTGLLVVGAAFALAVIAFGRWRGVSALAGLAVTFGVLVLFVVPAILAGEPPVLVALVGSAAIMLTVLYLTHGFTMSTTVALMGTLISLGLTGLLSAVAVAGLHLTGFTDDLATSVGTSYSVNMQGLLLAGIVIGSLGVLDDVAITQAATVHEVARANPAYGLGQLYRAGTRVGRSHIASVINTIVLAYAGASLPLLILVVASEAPLAGVVTSQVITQEIVRSAVATLGLIAAVPVTTGLAALAARRAT
ncbi:YibE/F family protein [Nocardioides coralli]|uniref:YibE/F family protein n=1 Tax=Nocardioides coralli TaxID=2872154 RepID=UPI001CA3F227|nr:YibE/F family protein [Nocardioides coralli]QZY30122.1 YibE/F family protein [Nocardioides coralli]